MNGSVPTALGCSSGIYPYHYSTACVAGRCAPYNPSTGGYPYNYWTQNYWYNGDWRNYWGDAWVYCTWPGGGGWYLAGNAPFGAYCS